jgi:hypothetical protein
MAPPPEVNTAQIGAKKERSALIPS